MRELKPLICRVCLQIGENLISIFEYVGQRQVFEHVMQFADVIISADDALPTSLCLECLSELQTAISFKEKCEEADLKLRKIEVKIEALKKSPVFLKEETIDEPLYEEFNDNTECSEPFDNFIPNTEDHKANPDVPAPAKGQLFSPQCNECLQYFRSKCRLRVHWKKEHSHLLYLMCQVCKRGFKSKKAYDNHKTDSKCLKISAHLDKMAILGERKSRIFKCNSCNYTTKAFEHIKAHFVSHTSDVRPFKCQVCPKTYTQRGSLDCHIAEKHSVLNPTPCHVCGKMLISTSHSYRHMRKHTEKKYPCPICNQLFKRKEYIKIHLTRHTGVKAYQCKECELKFYSSAELCTHSKKHKKTLIRCDQCCFECKNKKRMEKHIVQHGAGRLVPCVICGYFYESDEHLEKHLKNAHTNRKFHCPDCPNKYASYKSTRRHMTKNHGSQPPYDIKPIFYGSKSNNKTKIISAV